MPDIDGRSREYPIANRLRASSVSPAAIIRSTRSSLRRDSSSRGARRAGGGGPAGGGHPKADDERLEIGRLLCLPVGDGPPRHLVHLQRPDQPPAVGRGQALRRRRGGGAHLFQERGGGAARA